MGPATVTRGRPWPPLAAAGLLAVKVILGLWAAVALLFASSDDPTTFLGETLRTRRPGLAVLILVLAAVTSVVATGLVRRHRWAPAAAIVLEAVAIALAISRLGAATAPAIVSIALSLLIIALLVIPVARASQS